MYAAYAALRCGECQAARQLGRSLRQRFAKKGLSEEEAEGDSRVSALKGHAALLEALAAFALEDDESGSLSVCSPASPARSLFAAPWETASRETSSREAECHSVALRLFGFRRRSAESNSVFGRVAALGLGALADGVVVAEGRFRRRTTHGAAFPETRGGLCCAGLRRGSLRL